MIAVAFTGEKVIRLGLERQVYAFCGKIRPLVQHEPVNKLDAENNMKILNSATYLLHRAHMASETADEESQKS